MPFFFYGSVNFYPYGIVCFCCQNNFCFNLDHLEPKLSHIQPSFVHFKIGVNRFWGIRSYFYFHVISPSPAPPFKILDLKWDFPSPSMWFSEYSAFFHSSSFHFTLASLRLTAFMCILMPLIMDKHQKPCFSRTTF